MKWIVDRIEEGLAVCIPADNEHITIHVPIQYLPSHVQEGDHLLVSIQIDEASTRRYRQEAERLLEELTENQSEGQKKFTL
ncbi:MAG: DUF3006 domain-containing protein [Acidobacteriota bacterium]|nr:DUF3006 domain-containing protein [Blastocatellia bacterium]MDW8240044.1 DUF3006 domain-containing protein [Acidobacteriota bacterium]